MTETLKGYKCLTHDYRPPIQGGDPIWSGNSGEETPTVGLDTSDADCGTGGGWHFCREPETALVIAGLWPNGRPSVVVEIETVGAWVERQDKCRAEQLRFGRQLPEAEVEQLVAKLSSKWFPSEYRDRMAQSQSGVRPDARQRQVPICFS